MDKTTTVSLQFFCKFVYKKDTRLDMISVSACFLDINII